MPAPVAWMTSFLLRIRSVCWCEAHGAGGVRGRQMLLEAKQQVRLPSAVKRNEIQPAFIEHLVYKLLGKEKSKREGKSRFIHLLYTIVRHKFKQQRIRKIFG